MSLLDLKSDLSKYRWKGPTAPVDPNSRTPRALTYGDNFSSFQPISNTFINRGDLPKINSPKEVDLIGKLKDTRLDDIQNTLTDMDVTKKLGTTRLDDVQKLQNTNILVNSVSQFSPQNKDYNTSTFGRTSVTDVVSQLSRIETDVTQTNITESKVDVIKRDNQSGNIRVPDVVITPQQQILEKSNQAPFIIKDPNEAINNIRVPLVRINVPRQTKNREEESPNINNNPGALDLLINNDPNTILQSSTLDLNGTPIRYGGETRFIGDLSKLNLDSIRITSPSGRHETDSNSNLSNKNGQELNQFTDDNALGFTTNAQPLQTDYKTNSSTLGYDTILESNYFDINNTHTTDGFHAFAQPAEPTKYKTDSSIFDWDGLVTNAPSVDYFDPNNKNTTEGFHTFSKTLEVTKYKLDSSVFDWDGFAVNAPSVDYFDRNKRNTIQGFHTFAFEKEPTKYKTDSSRFDWDGDRTKAPSVDYFDQSKFTTWRGFHNFAFTKEPTSYATTANGQLVLAGGRPVTLTFGVTQFDWNGFRTNAPSVNYFDQFQFTTWRGFHTFAFEKEPTSYATTANGQLVLAGGRPVILTFGVTRFDWNGFRRNAPSVNFFDQLRFNSWRGFHTFAFEREPTSYQTIANGQLVLQGGPPVTLTDPATIFDWNGLRAAAPAVNFFDLIPYFSTWRGFHTFAQPGYRLFPALVPTSYATTANNQLVQLGGPPVTLAGGPLGPTQLDWDGLRAAAPAVNFFDLIPYFSTWRGFHTFAQPGYRLFPALVPTSYATTANNQLVQLGGPPVTLAGGPLGPTQLDWDGLRAAAPAVNFFDLIPYFSTWRGFHTFAQPGYRVFPALVPTSYATTANNQLVTQGNIVTLSGGTLGASVLDWDGLRAAAPAVNFFDLTNPFATWQGFHTFAQPIFGPLPILVPTSYQTTANNQLVTQGNIVTLQPNASLFDWNGPAIVANIPAVNFFDLTAPFATWRGFHTFAQPIFGPLPTLVPTSYQTTANNQLVTQGNIVTLQPNASLFDWDGPRGAARAVNFFDLTAPFATWRGFHTFAQPFGVTRVPTSYQTTANNQLVPLGGPPVTLVGGPLGPTQLDWDGLRAAAPAVNFFDLTTPFSTWRGFHTFAQPFGGPLPTLVPTSYATTANNQLVTQGNIVTLAPGASIFDWNGTAVVQNIPTVNFFDLRNPFATWRGFHAFAQRIGVPLVPTSYQTTLNGLLVTPGNIVTLVGGPLGPTRLDWDGRRAAAPAVNFFDQLQFSTWRGFHTFAQPFGGPLPTLVPTSYQTTANNQLVRQGNIVTLRANASIFDWNGPRANAIFTAVNFFDPQQTATWRGFHPFAQQGGTIFPQLVPTSYQTTANGLLVNPGRVVTLRPNASFFDWDGPRGAARAVNFFDLTNPFATWRGFHTFAQPIGVGRVPTSYATTANNQLVTLAGPLTSLTTGALGATQLDWDGVDPYSMRTTNFFGFTPTTRFGFIVNMSQFDGTAYPIINPRFTANIIRTPGVAQRAQRFGLSLFRQILQPLQTRNLEQFAPLTLGGKTISGFRSTLDVQIPAVTIQKLNINIATNRVRLNPTAPNFTKRYTTGGGVDIRPSVVDGNMEGWSNINNQLIDQQQSKYSLVTEAYNDDIFMSQPFIDGSLKGPDFIKISKFDDGLIRGGVIANTVRTFLDTKRIGKFLLSARGVLWNIKQAGLQSMNPNVDAATRRNPVEQFLSLGKVPTQVYNPLSVPLNVAGRSALIGRRFTRHGILMDGVSGRYESVAVERSLNLDDYSYFDELVTDPNDNYNRLIGLVRELLPNSYDPIRENKLPQKDTQLEINRISSGFGGPNSLLGFFGTTINRAKHPFKIVNTTEYFPDKINIGLGFDREVFFSGRYENSATQPDTYASMLSRELQEYQGDMYGLILSAANISSQTFTPTWADSSKNIFDAKNIKFQLFSQERINSTRVFDFKKPTTTERFYAMNSGYIPYRDYNESIADEVFFRGPEFGLTYFDRLFGQPEGEFSKYNGEIFGIVLGATLGQSGSFSPFLPFGPLSVKPNDFKIPLNSYDTQRILNLSTFTFKQTPITERGRAVTSTNIISRENLIDLASDIMFFKGSLLNKDTSILRDFYGQFLKTERANFFGNTFGLSLAISVNDKLIGNIPYLKDIPELKYNYSNVRINSKTKTLLQKIQPFKFIIPLETDRYSAVTSETAVDSANIQNATSLLDLVKYGVQREGKISYSQKLKNDYSNTNGIFKGLALAAARLGVKAAKVSGKPLFGVESSDLTSLTVEETGQIFGVVNGQGMSSETQYLRVGGPRFEGESSIDQFNPDNIVADNDPFLDQNTKNRINKLAPFRFKYPSDFERVEAMTADKIDREKNPLMALGPNNGTPDTLKNKFSVQDYFQFGIGGRDFRNLLVKDEKFSTDPNVVDHVNLALEYGGPSSAGMGDPGRAGSLRAFPFISKILYTSGLTTEQKSNQEILAGKSVLDKYYIANRKYGAYPTEKSEVFDLHRAFDSDVNGFWNTFRGDRINVIDWKRQEDRNINIESVYEHTGNRDKTSIAGAQDSIQFYFSGVDLVSSAYRPTEALVFRAYIDTIVDNHKPTWTPIKYIGRADPVYSYDGYEREISFGFTIHIGSRDELKATWRKLNMLASWTSPDYIDPGFMKAPICRLNIGNLYRKFPGFISTLNYTFDNTQTTWETAKLAEDLDIVGKKEIITADGKERYQVGKLTAPGALELPKTIIVQCTFVTFNIYRPQWDCVFYSLFDDRRGDSAFENGLVPMSSDRVNYFRTHDDLPMNHPMNAILCSVVPPPPPPPPTPETTSVTEETTEIITTTPPPTTPPPTTPPPTPTVTGTGTVTVTSTVTPPPTPTVTPPPTTTPFVVPPCVCRIDFCFDEDREITPPSRTAIRTYVEWLKRCPDLKVKVTGYCSKERDNKQYNLYLSWARATTVANLLVEEFGIDPNRLVVDGQGFGTVQTAYKPTGKGPNALWPAQENRRVEITPISGETVGCEPPKACSPKQCPKTATCWRKDGTKFWRVGPHYFTGTALIEENGKNVGQSYCGWPQGYPNLSLYYEPRMGETKKVKGKQVYVWDFKLPPHVDQITTFNAYTKLNLTAINDPGDSLKIARENWADFYIVQQPDNSDTPYWPPLKNGKMTQPPVPAGQVVQKLWKAWFTPLKDAKQTFEYGHTSTKNGPTVRLRPNPNEPIDIWQRRKDRMDWEKAPSGGHNLNKNDQGYNSDGLDAYTYIFDPAK